MAKYDEVFWKDFLTHASFKRSHGKFRRIVESQEQATTMTLVDSLDEQQILEEILEATKPKFSSDLSHLESYLLRTPWRYPPLKWGSRFGRKHERSLFYASIDQEALFAEAAYYRWLFYLGPKEPIAEKLMSKHTTFCANYQLSKGLHLERPPMNAFNEAFTHPKDYATCQSLGTQMRESGVEGFTFQSSRTKTTAVNIALFDPLTIISPQPSELLHWACETTKSKITFRSTESTLLHFYVEDFLFEGTFPIPALI